MTAGGLSLSGRIGILVAAILAGIPATIVTTAVIVVATGMIMVVTIAAGVSARPCFCSP